MKIRNGFVSNSSSSSFVCMTTKEISDRAEATLTEEERDTLENVLYSYRIGDKVLIGYESSYIQDHGGYIGEYSTIDDYENYEKCDKAADAWRNAVKKVGGENPIIEIDIDL